MLYSTQINNIHIFILYKISFKTIVYTVLLLLYYIILCYIIYDYYTPYTITGTI